MSSSKGNCAERAIIGRCLDSTSTDELARYAKAGNREAFAVVAKRLRPRLLVVLGKRMEGRRADAEDVAQETLTRAWQNIGTYEDTRSFTAWVYAIAFRRAVDHLRSHGRRLRHIARVAVDEAIPADPQQALIDKDAAENVWAVAKRVLTVSQYSALWLRYAEELSVREIADTIGKTEVATRVLLHRARGTMQAEFPEQGPAHE